MDSRRDSFAEPRLALWIALAAWLAADAFVPFGRLVSLGRYRIAVEVADVLFGVAIVAAAIGIRSIRLFSLRGVFSALALFALLSAVSSIAGDGDVDGLRLSSGTFALLGIAWLTAELAGLIPSARELLARLTMVQAVAVFAMAIVGLTLFAVERPTELIGTYGDLPPREWYARVQAGFAHPNLLASWCIVASTIVAWSGATNRPALRRVAQVLLAVTVLTTFSRATLGFAVAAAWRSGRRTLALGVTALAVTLVVSLVFVNTRPGGGESVRQQTITSAAATVVDRPLLGVGLGNLPAEANGGEYRAHLTPLDIAATQGIPALLCLAAAIVILWRQRSRPTDLALWGGMAGLGIDALGQDIQHFRHVWLLLGLVAADAMRRDTSDAEPT